MATIYNYFDVLRFLHDDFEERRRKNPLYSLRAMARKLHLNSGTVSRIMKGQRNISKNLLPRFITYLGLKNRESEYFSCLVPYCQGKTGPVKRIAYGKLMALRNELIRYVPQELHEFYEEWYYTAILQLLRIYPFSGDYESLAHMLNPVITVHEARRAIQLLEQFGFIIKEGNVYSVRDQNVSTGAEWQSAAIHRFQQGTLKLAQEALDTIPREEIDYSTMTMCYSQEGYRKVRELFKCTREELSRIEKEDGECKRVYQINFQVFPCSKWSKGADDVTKD